MARHAPQKYPSWAKFFHAVMALLFVLAYATIFIREDMPQGPWKLTLIHWHASLGLSILFLSVFRLAYRLTTSYPKPLTQSRFQGILAHAVHGILLVATILMPLSAYLSFKRNINFFNLFEFKNAVNIGLINATTADSLRPKLMAFHEGFGANVLLYLIILHAIAALYHHFYLKDATLRRMWAWNKK